MRSDDLMIEVRRSDDDELCGYVLRGAYGSGASDGGDHGGPWQALTVFGGLLGTHDTPEAAEAQVLEDGLSSLAEHWLYRADASEDWQMVCIQEASPQSVRIALDFYSMPGVPTVMLSSDAVLTGGMLRRNR